MSKQVLASRKSPDDSRGKFVDLDPELREIFGPPPLYEGESEEDYGNLHHRIRQTVAPSDVIEEIWVRDLVDLTWETLRLRRLKAKFMDAASSKGIEHVLENSGLDYFEQRQLLDGWVNGEVDARKQINQLLEKSGLDKTTVQAQTLAARLDDFERIDRLIMQSEARRNAVIREVDRHRDAVARRLRDAISDIEDAEFEEVQATKSEEVA
jgi:hypothetical protein